MPTATTSNKTIIDNWKSLVEEGKTIDQIAAEFNLTEANLNQRVAGLKEAMVQELVTATADTDNPLDNDGALAIVIKDMFPKPKRKTSGRGEKREAVEAGVAALLAGLNQSDDNDDESEGGDAE